MQQSPHSFHIPVMGTGHSADTPIRVAHLGINSVISLVDDILLDNIREYYSRKLDLPYFKIARDEMDARAKRITAYLDMVNDIVQKKMEDVKKQPFGVFNDKKTYFELLPEDSYLKKAYLMLLDMNTGPDKKRLEEELTSNMKPGSIDVNIMVKLDKENTGRNGKTLSEEFSDAKAALRGYANSQLQSCIVFSAGLNKSLFNYMTQFRDFYRDATGDVKKKIVIKVSDLRSALIQGKFLAKNGLEIHEFRIESGLNCGGHAFPTNGTLLPNLLQEFKEKRDKLANEFRSAVEKYYDKFSWDLPKSWEKSKPLVTVQGGIGTSGEVRRLSEDFMMDLTGWGSPFLLTPEATCIDPPSSNVLKNAGRNMLYLSGVSPLGVPFNNVHNTGSEIWTRKRIETGKPGSPCPKGYLRNNTEFTKKVICVASRKYQKLKLAEISGSDIPEEEKENQRVSVLEKTCICHHLGNGALVALGIRNGKRDPQSVCPGPNLAWFDKTYTLKEMIDHIYGRGRSLVSSDRPHMFANEIIMYVDYFEKQVGECKYSDSEIKRLRKFKSNLDNGMAFCLEIAKRKPYQNENLASIPVIVGEQKSRMKSIYKDFEKKAGKMN